MSKLEQLIKELCPDGVEYKNLGGTNGIAEIGTGNCNTVDAIKNGKYKFYVRSAQILKIDTYEFDEECIITSGDGAGVGKILHYVNGKFNLHQRAYRIKINNSLITTKFLFCLMKNNFERYILDSSVSSSVTSIRKHMLEKYTVPIPPLPIQEEIVRILDTFNETQTELINQLEEELKARKQQYEFHRDSLLTFGDDVEYKPLDKIKTDMYRGSGIKRDQVTKKGIPCVRYGEIYTIYNLFFDECVSHTLEEDIPNKKYFGYGDIIFAITGESIEDIAKSTVYLGHERCLAGGDTVVMKHNENPKFLSYALSTKDARMQKSKGKVKNKVVHSSIPSLKEIKIPIPSTEEQQRIVTILDNLDSQVTEITNKLSEEISARKQQYEYYRDKLLTFKELKHE